jgi:hypothetical protein
MKMFGNMDFARTATAAVGALVFTLASLAVAVSPAVQAGSTNAAQLAKASTDAVNA